MKTITAAEAQQLANLLGLPVTQDATGCKAWDHASVLQSAELFTRWFGNFPVPLPIRIASDRPWTEQIWRPETYNKETDK